MKNLLLLFSVLTLLTSCEDVIDVDVPTSTPKLVIDASINWYNNTSGNDQIIKLTLSSQYFDDEILPASGATITISDINNTVFEFIETNSLGYYLNNSFNPKLNESYTLTVVYQNESYTATEKLESVSPIDFIEQKNDGGFSGEDIEIKAFYTDPPNEDNFYLYRFSTPTDSFNEVYDDEFTDGNQIFAFYASDNLIVGDEIIITAFGVSEQFYNFFFILRQQSGDGGGGPFETQPATVRGNIKNTTNPDNFPFGYFRLSQADRFEYIVE